MAEPLTPEEVDELRPANEPKKLMMNTTTTRLIATVDALAEALRIEDIFRRDASLTCPGCCAWDDEPHKPGCPLARVTAWLEKP